MRTLLVAITACALVLGACTTSGSVASPSAAEATAATQPSDSQAPASNAAPATPTPTPSAAPTAVPTSAPTPPPTAAPVATTAPTATVGPSAALGFTPGTKTKPRIVAITADDGLAFFPNVIPAAQGETVTFKIHNVGKATHEFMLGPADDAFADADGTPELEDIGAGETKSLTYTFTGPGPYAFACHEAGHFEAGMLGYVIVQGPDVPAVGTKASPRLVAVDMSDKLQFTPTTINVTRGETITFLITNDGTATHEFALGPADKVDADQVDGTIVVEADEILEHHVKTVTYTFAGAGPYGFACHEPGHFEAGMKGAIVLVGP